MQAECIFGNHLVRTLENEKI